MMHEGISLSHFYLAAFSQFICSGNIHINQTEWTETRRIQAINKDAQRESSVIGIV